jgi:hypothetical protein
MAAAKKADLLWQRVRMGWSSATTHHSNIHKIEEFPLRGELTPQTLPPSLAPSALILKTGVWPKLVVEIRSHIC